MRKKIIITVLILFFSFSALNFDAYAFSASSAAVMLSATGEILFEKDSHRKMSMASTTKIMTALLAVESGRLGETVTVTDEMVRVEGTSMGLRAGNRLTLRNLVKGMMLLSGNDAANAVAVFLSGTVSAFAALMNERASEIGMRDTHFVTPSGLDDEEHYSTAYDMALLACAAMNNPDFREAVGEYSGKVEYISPDVVYTYRNHNRFLKMYEGACGIKTGFTKKSGRCLATAVERDGTYVVAVTLKAPDDWNDHISLYNECLPLIKTETVDDSFNCLIPVAGGMKSEVNACVADSITVCSESGDISTVLYTEKLVYAPVEKGDILGFVRVLVNGKRMADYPVTADESVEKLQINPSEMGFSYRIRELFRRFERWLTAA